MEKTKVSLKIRGARENNLKTIDIDIPLNKFIVITGISGSGKSSLAFDVIVKEGQRRYLESVPGFARRFTGKLTHPNVDDIVNLPPVIAISQKAAGGGSRSTLGTMSDLYDYLRLLFARVGVSEHKINISRSLFSFNSPAGACPHCFGLGLEEKISLDKLIIDPSKSLRQGALAPTLPTGYIMYTQLTMDSMDMLCKAHGFSVDVPWNEMSNEQQEIVLYGSNKIKVPIGKHSLESRLKWEGIAAKPREEDYYKGIITIMSDILRRDRNKNILKYVESLPCSRCGGSRLNEDAMSVLVHGNSIAGFCAMELHDLKISLQNINWTTKESMVAKPLVSAVAERIERFEMLGMGHLSLDQPTETLSMGDTRRIRLINQITAGLSDVLYVFDEAFVGLHPHDHKHLLNMMQELVAQGNTVVLVEHEEQCIRQADYIIDIGPKAGENGGKLLFSGNTKEFFAKSEMLEISLTAKSLSHTIEPKTSVAPENGFIVLDNANSGNLKDVKYCIKKSSLNVLTGLSGAGKSTLIYDEFLSAIERKLEVGSSENLHGFDDFKQVHIVSRKPIGRTPRSNPATYTKLSDSFRDIFAKQEQAKVSGLKKSHFSFNTKGGRCETCMGAGKIQIGMHFLGNVDLDCPECKGKRFKPEILKIKYKGKSIADVYNMTVNQAIDFFASENKIVQTLENLQSLGLGYLKLGQSSTSLSGGEAQRIKLASYLNKSKTAKALFILDEPANGLHNYDIHNLIKALDQLKSDGNTVVCIANNAEILIAADFISELGPGRGKNGGIIVAEGSPNKILEAKSSLSSRILEQGYFHKKNKHPNLFDNANIKLKGVSTHNLKAIDIEIPKGKMTVIAGISGSGKSSLAFDTIAAEAESRFNESMSAYARSFLQQANPAELESVRGLTPVMALSSAKSLLSERSTVGTMTGLYDYYRLLFSRISQLKGQDFTAQDFSFNHQNGACNHCNGLGAQLVCNPLALVTNPELSVLKGALCGSTPGRYFGNPDGQFIAILKHASQELCVDISLPFKDLSQQAVDLILNGTGNRQYELDWHYKNKSRSGVQHLKSVWPGFCHYIEDEFRRKHQNKTGDKLRALMHEVNCPHCKGMRLQDELLDVKLAEMNIGELSHMSLNKTFDFFNFLSKDNLNKNVWKLVAKIRPRILDLLQMMKKLDIGYLSIDRRGNTLSGGEMQRVRLAGAFASPLYGVTYILDEPSVSLHQKNIPALLDVLEIAKTRGNTLILVEHDARFMRTADHIIELGPGAGHKGGEIIASGTYEDVVKLETHTSVYLKNETMLTPEFVESNGLVFGVKSAMANNLKNIDVEFSSRGLIAVCGVSGSGKSSLIRDVLMASINAGHATNCDSLYGFDQFNSVRFISQKNLNVSKYSSVFTASGMMDEIRTMFASCDDAKHAGLRKSSFSYVHKDGKCPECNGHGIRHLAMDFMSDIDVPCDVCNGLRYKPEVLRIKCNGKNIGEVLNMNIHELLDYVKSSPKLVSALHLMQDLGLGHLTGGQSVKSLSAGEKQRVKLLSDLLNTGKGNCLFVFDEPAAGLHHHDILKLINVFKRLVSNGHTVIYVEHRSELLNVANQLIELGPGAGDEGGSLMSNVTC